MLFNLKEKYLLYKLKRVRKKQEVLKKLIKKEQAKLEQPSRPPFSNSKMLEKYNAVYNAYLKETKQY